jgi:hypothetical protein
MEIVLNQTVGIHKNNLDRKGLNYHTQHVGCRGSFSGALIFSDGTLNKQNTSAVDAQDSHSGGFPFASP